MLFAAGIGSRLQPITYKKPKALVEVGGKTMLEHSIHHLAQYGFNDIIINLHHFPEKIKAFLEERKWPASISYSDETDLLRDTGGGLQKASWFFSNEPFLVYNVDILTNMNLGDFINFHFKKNGIATLAVRKRKSSRYLILDKNNRLIGWENSKTHDKKTIIKSKDEYNVAFSGIHVIDPRIFMYFPNSERFPIIQAYLDIASKHEIYGYIDEQSYWFDVGNLEKLEKAHNFMQNKK